MRTIGASLEAHLAGETTTVCTIWKLTRADGAVYGFTDHDANLVVSGITYKAATGYTRSAVRAQLGLFTDDVEIEGLLDSAEISEQDIRAGRWDYASVEIFLVNWADLSMGTLKLARGKIGTVQTGRSTFKAELRGLTENLSQAIGRLYMPTCDADLGDARCGINLATYTFNGVVSAVVTDRDFTTSLGSDDGYWDGGIVTFTSGNNTGLSMEVKASLLSGGAIALQLAMPRTVQAGDTFTISTGCDKSFATCKAKFNNGVNFQGFPHIPGLRRMITGGRGLGG